MPTRAAGCFNPRCPSAMIKRAYPSPPTPFPPGDELCPPEASFAVCSFSIQRWRPVRPPMASISTIMHHRCSSRSVRCKDGKWSDAKTWAPPRAPTKGDRVLVSRGTQVEYDVASQDVIRLIQVVGTLQLRPRSRHGAERRPDQGAEQRRVQRKRLCLRFRSRHQGWRARRSAPGGGMPALVIGTPEEPIPAEHTARIRLHYLEGMNKDDAPAIVCCSARMEIHGSPLSRTWVKLGQTAKAGRRHRSSRRDGHWRGASATRSSSPARSSGGSGIVPCKERGGPARPRRRRGVSRPSTAIRSRSTSRSSSSTSATASSAAKWPTCRAT